MTVTMTRRDAIAALTAPGEPYELQDQVVAGRRCRVFVGAPPSLRELFAGTVSDAEFIVFEDERLSYADAYRQAAAIARVLVDHYGVRPGDRVAISMRNFPEWITAFTAVTSVGAIAVAMNALWQAEEMAYGLRDSGARVLFADAERLERLARIDGMPDVEVIAVRPAQPDPGYPVLADLIEAVGDCSMPDVAVAADDPATIFYTSGSTGHPKGVVSTHRNILSALFSWELDLRAAGLMAGVTPPQPEHQPATLLAVPLFHATGSHAVYLMSYRAQRKLVSMYKWDAALAAELIERERITQFVAPAAMTGDLVRIARETDRDLSSLATVGGGGAPRAPEQVRQIGSSFAKALPNTGWGMTETNAIGTGIGGEEYLQRPASSGRCSAVLELKVVSPDGTELPPGERGELLVRGTSLFHGYWNRPDVNEEVFVDGWFRTGDVAYLDDEGYLFIVDRIKDLIIRGGENIGCGEVEAALLTHPQVREAAVYAVPDERLGEEVGATVHGSAELDVDALRDYLGEHLARFQIPRYLTVTPDPLPRTASGKILKRELKEAAVAKIAAGEH
ncbi:MAG: class I adenylate-forming enzyme family protein [Pseudomonadales bacterium]